MKTIPLTRGKVAVVDDEDFERLNVHVWQADKQVRKCRVTWYASRKEWRGGHGQRKFLMHREVLKVTSRTVQVDHANGDTLDNQKYNLRLATHGQNKQNSRKTPGCTSRFKGVSWNKVNCRWEVRIGSNRLYLGCFENEEEAAAAYDVAAVKAFGAFASTNLG